MSCAKRPKVSSGNRRYNEEPGECALCLGGAGNHDEEQDSARRPHRRFGRLRLGPVRRRTVAGRRGAQGSRTAQGREGAGEGRHERQSQSRHARSAGCATGRREPASSRQPPREARRPTRRPRSRRRRRIPPRTAEYWRKRITDARQARDRNAFLLEAIQSRINALTADFSARDDPYQRAQIQTDRQKALAELDRMTKAQVELEQEDRGHRGRGPPGQRPAGLAAITRLLAQPQVAAAPGGDRPPRRRSQSAPSRCRSAARSAGGLRAPSCRGA